MADALRWLAASGRRASAAIVALVLARAAIYAVQGVGFIHDDWAMAGHGRLLGVAEISSTPLLEAARPGQWLVFAALFGVADGHPLVLFALLTALNALAALVLWRVLLRFVAPTTAVAAALVWVLVPNHNTLTAWGATSYVVVGLTLLLLAVLALADGRWWLAAPLLVLSVWSYEVAVVPALLAVAVVPSRLLLRPPTRPIPISRRLIVAALVVAAALRSVIDPIYPATPRLPDPLVAWWGHFGTGLLGSDDLTVLWLGLAATILLGTVASVVAWLRGVRGRESGPALVVAGLVILAAGLGAGFTIPLGSAGMSDRLHSVSSIGSALVLVGLAQGLRSWRPALLLPAVAVLAALCVFGQVVSLTQWGRAAGDVQALVRAIDEQVDDPAGTRIVVGPAPLDREGVRPLSGSETRWIVPFFWGEGSGSLVLSTGPQQFRGEGPDDVLIRWDAIVDTSTADEVPTTP